MNNKNAGVLLKTLLLSTSGRNIKKHTTDKKRKSKVNGSSVAFVILYFMLIFYAVLISVGLGVSGYAEMIPALTAITISAISFMLTFFKSNGYLFGYKEYDILMSMPFEVKTIVGCKFLYMYLKSMPWVISLSISMLIGFAIFEAPAWYVYPLWIALSVVVPLIPVVIASILGVFVAGIGSGFKYKRLVQTGLMFVVLILAFCSRFIIESVMRNNEMEDIAENVTAKLDPMKKMFFQCILFEKAILEPKGVLWGILLVIVSVLVFVVFYEITARFYRRINTKLSSHYAKNSYKVKSQKTRSVIGSIAFKEFRQMMGSTNYMVNATFGQIAILLLSLVLLFVDPQKVVGVVVQGVDVPLDKVLPVIPFVVYFFIGMVATTCMTPSLEGKNDWIIQSLPITKKQLYYGKILFQMILSIPVALFGVLVMGIAFGAGALDLLLFVICELCLCLFSTMFGMVCGLKFIKLDWENDIEVVKQGAAVTVYLLPNMFVTMGLGAGAIVLNTFGYFRIGIVIISLVYLILALLCYLRVLARAKK